MKVASLVLMLLVALTFGSGCIMVSFADPIDPPVTPDGNGRPHKSIRLTTLEGKGTITPKGNGRPHK